MISSIRRLAPGTAQMFHGIGRDTPLVRLAVIESRLRASLRRDTDQIIGSGFSPNETVLTRSASGQVARLSLAIVRECGGTGLRSDTNNISTERLAPNEA